MQRAHHAFPSTPEERWLRFRASYTQYDTYQTLTIDPYSRIKRQKVKHQYDPHSDTALDAHLGRERYAHRRKHRQAARWCSCRQKQSRMHGGSSQGRCRAGVLGCGMMRKRYSADQPLRWIPLVIPRNGYSAPSGALLCPTSSATATFIDSQVHKCEPAVINDPSASGVVLPQALAFSQATTLKDNASLCTTPDGARSVTEIEPPRYREPEVSTISPAPLPACHASPTTGCPPHSPLSLSPQRIISTQASSSSACNRHKRKIEDVDGGVISDQAIDGGELLPLRCVLI
jgi:hypothetical protein